tara:strand:- start:248 stop:487 length:240 start_codon:yes stop_codon:yes gene_type:complete
MDKLKQVRKLGIKNNFKNIDSYTFNQINNLADDLDFIIEKDQLDNLQAYQEGRLNSSEVMKDMPLGDLQEMNKILEGSK